MAAYDYNDSNHNGFTGYELDPGDYSFPSVKMPMRQQISLGLK